MNIAEGFGSKNAPKDGREQVKLATINGYMCLTDDMETKVGQFLIASSCKLVPERDDRSTMLQVEVLTIDTGRVRVAGRATPKWPMVSHSSGE